jgi:hypothetical protein
MIEFIIRTLLCNGTNRIVQKCTVERAILRVPLHADHEPTK